MPIAKHIQILRRRTWFSSTPTWLVVVMLAVLNPLACLIHCAVTETTHNTIATSHFLCAMTQGDTTINNALFAPTSTVDELYGAASSAADTKVPRAVYEGVSLIAIIVALLLSLVRSLDVRSLGRMCDRLDSPPSPPPRFA